MSGTWLPKLPYARASPRGGAASSQPSAAAARFAWHRGRQLLPARHFNGILCTRLACCWQLDCSQLALQAQP